MKDSTETLLMLAELLEAEPPILPPEAVQPAQELAANLQNLSEADINQASDMIIDWIGQFPQAQNHLKKARRQRTRKQADELEEDSPDEIQYTIPNFQIIEETETLVIITPAPNSPQISLFIYVRESLSRWIQKK
ncbi:MULTISPECIES: hypothetical protein [Arthrospira]|uniref:hypothetical protein n=1 Tax=Oscillatoriales TaxID=1150 RepID=UPI0001C384B7|nr:hypothetical protein [Arthrospira platensis]AMW27464.1 hypothetical protein AP285_05185 [Arthrospira platensis YZ]KDR59015.1 hypothetical protein APPUASWS_001685 [Arthrospira platensis str. Paraca]MBD2668050.1 hypothetical protein [Arthrospira platensis FACHB-439]MBD2712005.1 hypothetical protein [Arthrospira platensis FACHB-835]MDF2210955.1 hypothetical protein [Arthrospira platensis NCB002]MDT9310100.1 hypothetical protein [Limnospira sp. Paracas R14]QQW30223.1 hypothetical protein AP91